MVGAFKCPGCEATTWGDLKYCPKCGEPLTRMCPGCGGTWRYVYEADYRFCPFCGSRVEQSTLER